MSSAIYLDNAATTALLPEVREAMLPYLSEAYGNPSSLYQLGQQSRVAIEGARREIARLLHAEQGHLLFTSGGTEANNWALKGVIEAHNIQNVLVSPIEHMSVLGTLRYLADRGKIQLHDIPILSNGMLDLNGLEKIAASFPGALVSTMHGNNEIGTLTNIKEVAHICATHGLLLHSDMVQTVGYEQIELDEWGVDLATFSAHKFHGPKGVGALYIKDGLSIHPLIHGGKQEKEMRPGTENVAGIVGMAKALEIIKSKQNEIRRHLLTLKEQLYVGLREVVPGIIVHGTLDQEASLPTILSIAFPWKKYRETLITQLDILGIQASSGSACMSGTSIESHVIKALAQKKNEPIVRFSFSAYNTLNEIHKVVKKIGTL